MQSREHRSRARNQRPLLTTKAAVARLRQQGIDRTPSGLLWMVRVGRVLAVRVVRGQGSPQYLFEQPEIDRLAARLLANERRVSTAAAKSA